MKKLSASFAVVAALSLFLLSACTSDPEKSTQKDMLKKSPFICDYTFDGEAHDFKLTINKDNTYTLYIRDYANSTNDNLIMETCTGTWSCVITYEYDYRTYIHMDSDLTTKKTAVVGIYYLEGYQFYNYRTESLEKAYFAYHKSEDGGQLFSTNRTVDEAYLEGCRKKISGFPTGLAGVDVGGIYFKSEQGK